jgi:hypothetical protein
MKKIKLLGLGNEKGRSYFVFEKTMDFFPFLSSFLDKLNLEKTGTLYEYQNKTLLMDELVDRLENVKNDFFDIDIFFGKETITIVIRSEKDREVYMPLIKKLVEYKGF